MPKLNMVEEGANSGNKSNQIMERPADMFSGRSSLSPRIDNDERAIN
jgi:hypothetical protein